MNETTTPEQRAEIQARVSALNADWMVRLRVVSSQASDLIAHIPALLRSDEARARITDLVGEVTPCPNCDGSGKNAQGSCCRIRGHARECVCLICQWKNAAYRNENEGNEARAEIEKLKADLQTERVSRMKGYLKSPAMKTFAELKHSKAGTVLAMLQDGAISRGKACEVLAELAHGVDWDSIPLPAEKGNQFAEDEIPAEVCAAQAERIERLNAAIESGPHAEDCESLTRFIHMELCHGCESNSGKSSTSQLVFAEGAERCHPAPCNCWKSSVPGSAQATEPKGEKL